MRRKLEMTLNDFEALLERLNAGEPIPNAMLAEGLEVLRACASGGQEPNAYIPPTDRAALLLRHMFWALESLERGEIGAAGEFVRNGRDFLRLLRPQPHGSSSGEGGM